MIFFEGEDGEYMYIYICISKATLNGDVGDMYRHLYM